MTCLAKWIDDMSIVFLASKSAVTHVQYAFVAIDLAAYLIPTLLRGNE